MAFDKTIESQYNVDVTYWNIAGIHQDFLGQIITIRMNGYVDKESRNSGASPISSLDIVLQTYAPDLTRADYYAIMKKYDQFQGATEV